MTSLVNWIKNNKLAFFLILIVSYFLYKSVNSIFGVQTIGSLSVPSTSKMSDSAGIGLSAPAGFESLESTYLPRPRQDAPPTAGTDRLVITDTSLSLLVEDVRSVTDKIVSHAASIGGYMVSRNLTRPEETPFATVVIRVPSDKLDETMGYYRSLSIKVSSENVVGRDVTDQYEDLDARIETLERTKAKFEEILDLATAVNEILQVQREIINLQTQIDNLKGRQLYLEQNAALSKITAYLSTDEIALPYTPDEAFRPGIDFKLAWRSLVRTLRSLVTYAIWVGVYAVVWIPVLIVIIAVKKRKSKSTNVN